MAAVPGTSRCVLVYTHTHIVIWGDFCTNVCMHLMRVRTPAHTHAHVHLNHACTPPRPSLSLVCRVGCWALSWWGVCCWGRRESPSIMFGVCCTLWISFSVVAFVVLEHNSLPQDDVWHSHVTDTKCNTKIYFVSACSCTIDLLSHPPLCDIPVVTAQVDDDGPGHDI